jgi:oxygen-independent coproporphyrinogen-3 oxidase
MLQLRLAGGLDLGELLGGPGIAEQEVADGLLDAQALSGGRAVLTTQGRLLADGVARRLLA